MQLMKPAARLYVACVMIAGAALFAARVPHIQVDRPVVFVILILLSLATAALKVHLPLPGGGSRSARPPPR